MKLDDSQADRLPNPLPAVTFLNRPPEQSQLLELLLAAEKNAGTHYCFRWSSKLTGVILDLYVVTLVRAPQKDWIERKTSAMDEPEWQLHSEELGRRKQVWTLKTSDLNLLSNLIVSESAPKAPAQAATTMANTSKAATVPNFNKKTDSLQQAVLSRLGLTSDGTPNLPANTANTNLQLAGNIKDLDVINILQSINLCRMTGKLNLFQTQRQIEMYFADGDLLHARACQTLLTADQIVGEDAVLDAFTWEDGTFQFQHGWKVEQRSINRKLHAILLEGAALQDYRTSLNKQNLSQTSSLIVPKELAEMSEAALDAALEKGVPVHLPLQKIVFARLKKGAELRQLIDEMSLQGTVWIPIVFNLLDLKLIAIAGNPVV